MAVGRSSRSAIMPNNAPAARRLTLGSTRALSSQAMLVTVNGTSHRFDPPPATVAELVRALHLDGTRIAVEINGEIVPKSRYEHTRVAAGDTLEVVAAVGGG